jgi:hypothetical protein
MKGIGSVMELVQYIAFVVSALILAWAVVEISRRYTRQRKMRKEALTAWVKMDARHAAPPDPAEDLPPVLPGASDEEEEDLSHPDLRTRAKQNGHYSESKKPL